MKLIIKVLSGIFLVFMALTITSVQAASYRFEQSFPDGGKVTGNFEGKDTFGKLDSNGSAGLGADGNICFNLLGSCYGLEDNRGDELSNYSIHFSGNPEFDGFNQISLILKNLNYSIPSDLVIRYNNDIPDYFPGFFEYNFEKIITNTLDPNDPDIINTSEISPLGTITVTQTPLPSALLFFLSGLVGLFGIRRRLSTGNKFPI